MKAGAFSNCWIRRCLGLTALGLNLPLVAATLTLERTIPLHGVEGRIDHFSFDPAGARLFVAALGNNSVEVVDLKAGRVVRSLTGFAEPQGVLFVPEFGRLYVANGGDGTLQILDGRSYAVLKTVPLGEDADNLRYDSPAKRVYVGYGSGAFGGIDAATGEIVARIPLGAHPESFQLEPAGPRIFVNLPGAHAIGVVDRVQQKVMAKWSTGLTAANFPMALDEPRHRLFVACRLPACLLIFDTGNGAETARLDLHGDCDDLFYDPARGRLYASCGEGFIDVFEAPATGACHRVESVKTPARGRTSLLVGDILYVAVPHHGEQPAAMLCYRIAP